MARLKRELVAQREAEVREAFGQGGKPKDVNEALKAKYGKAMGPKRLYELYREAKAAAEQPLVVAEPVVVVEETAVETPVASIEAPVVEASVETV